MSFSVISGTLASAVADAGTFTASYPDGKNEGSFYNAMGHKLVIGQNNAYSFPDDFDVTLGTSSITITNKSATTWAAGSSFRLQVEEPGARGIRSDADGQASGALLASATKGEIIIVNLCPDVADADGISVSATVTSPANAVIGGALASGGVATFDTPRNVVGAWTNTATVTFTGTDVYGNTITETSASGTSHVGAKAFKTVTSVDPSATITSATFGSGNVIGLPLFLADAGQVLSVSQDGVRLPLKEVIQGEIDQTRLIAGTSVYVQNAHAGNVERLSTVMTTAVNTTGGSLTVEIATVAVTGLAVVVATGSVGDVDTDQPAAAVLTGADVTGLVAARAGIEIVGDAAFDSTGALNFILELNTQGIFQPGIRTSGGSTATTGDVRGTFRPVTAPDGDIVWQIAIASPNASFVGIAQA
jgi:hypothetical protein